jgi:hypothetical protein
MKIIGCLFRFLILGALVVLAFILLAPRFLQQAGNSLINAFNNSAANGIAQYIPANFTDSQSHLQVSVSGLSPSSQYYVTLDSSTCGGSPSMNIGEVTTDSSGSINKEFTTSAVDSSQTWYVVVHQGNDPSGTILACGQLSINGTSVAIVNTPVISLSPLPAGQTPNPSIGGETPTAQPGFPNNGFPNTGVKPDKNFYDNNVYPRKY